MDPKTESEIAFNLFPFARVYKDGRVERLVGTEIVPASLEPQNGVVSKDVVYSPENNLSVRLFIPQNTLESANPHEKLPLLVYFHGGAFIIGSPFAPTYHNYLTDVVAAARCVAVSVQYRRAPENKIPIPYEDSWAGLKWVWSHSGGNGPEEWLNRHADFNRAFIAGDSAGGNIAHHMGMKSAEDGEIKILGIFLANPYFWSIGPVDEEDIQDEPTRIRYGLAWNLVSPGSVDGNDDPLINVVLKGPSLAGMNCRRMLVMVAEKDFLVRQGLCYARRLKESGWGGEVEVVEINGEEHVFHLLKPTCENAKIALDKFVEFINKE